MERKDKNYNKKKISKYKDRPKKPKIVESEFIRLNRYIAASGVCSRRQADEFIQKGLVSVNGVVVTDYGTKVGKKDEVKYKGRVIKGEKTIYIIMNKPKDYITSLTDPQGRSTVMDLFKGKVKERIYPVGRLDRNTTGVLLFTNDGDLTTKLTHPKKRVKKIYVVTVDKPVTQSDMIKITEGIQLEDGFISADAIYYYNDREKNIVAVEIHSGRNRIVRRIFEHLDYSVKTLDRVEFAGLNKKNLKRGQWRFLELKEIGFIKMLAGK
ncbi:MAG: rRNA pseudouridine synthase [Bacteroidales bacterium]|nr:rRNA pseudouridine synthase [Bacteroidales bacterium]